MFHFNWWILAYPWVLVFFADGDNIDISANSLIVHVPCVVVAIDDKET